MRQAFLRTHPDLDPVTRRYVEDGSIEPSLDATAMAERVKDLQEEAAAQERARLQKQQSDEETRKAEARTREQERKKLEDRAYVVNSADPTGNTIGCDDAITLQAALEYQRVGDAENFRRLVGGFDGRCQILPKGQIVIPVVQRAEYWQVGVAAGAFPFPIGFWVPAHDLRKKGSDP